MEIPDPRPPQPVRIQVLRVVLRRPPPHRSVTASAASYPATAVSTAAASATVRAIGPPTSLFANSGIIPARLTSPIVGRTPTRSLCAEGPRIEFPVSVPSPTSAKLAATAAAVPPLLPAGTRPRSYAFRVVPPIELIVTYGLNAHSAMFDFPSTIAPASRSFRTIVASSTGLNPFIANDPPVVCNPRVS